MSISIGRFRLGKRQRRERDPEGRMTLIDHLRELRTRLLYGVGAILVGMIVALIFYDDFVFPFAQRPVREGIARYADLRGEDNITAMLNFGSVESPLLLMLMICLVAGLVATAPFWLYQIWAFIVPGLHANERKWSRIFAVSAGPLFLAGVSLGYLVMPLGIGVILGFTPAGQDLGNIIDIQYYLAFVLRLLVIFGVAFEIPIFVIALNMVGVLPAARLAKWRRGIIFSFFLLSAVVTPTTDPITMLLLAVPMTLLFVASEVAARFLEKRKRERLAAEGLLFEDDDEDEDEESSDDNKPS